LAGSKVVAPTAQVLGLGAAPARGSARVMAEAVAVGAAQEWEQELVPVRAKAPVALRR